MKVLEIGDVTKSFGGVVALNKVNMEVEEGNIHGLIGPNGAGKTTLFNLITGILTPNIGSIRFQGKNLEGLKPHQRTALGICRTYQNIKLFKSMTVLQNVMVARPYQMRLAFVQLGLKCPFREMKIEREIREKAEEMLQFVNLSEKSDLVAASLPYGEQRRLEIARALATQPSLLLLDEPCAGMSRREKEHMINLIREIRAKNVTLLVIEHDMSMVSEISDIITVLNFGVVIAQDSPEPIQINPVVIEAYLGREKKDNA
jgi:branched-chain amino acid transport system ATP-binding protein